MEFFKTYVRQHKLLTGLIGVFFLFLLVRFLVGQGDFNVFYAAAVRFLEGAEIHRLSEVNHFSYPTVAALFFVPGTLFGHAAAKIFFLIASFSLMLLGVRLINESVLGRSSSRALIFSLALLFSFRFFLDVYGNEQTDFLVFGLVIAGAYFFQRHSLYSALCWAAAAALKANPLFLILVPIFYRQWKIAAYFLALVLALFLLPDALKYGVETTAEPYTLELPERVIARGEAGAAEMTGFKIIPVETTAFSYLKSFVNITFSGSGESWWSYRNGPLNQSLTRIATTYLGLEVSSYWTLLALCSIFGLALMYLSFRGASVFMVIMLCYSSFVLIGPMASKPHFIAVYPLLAYCWKYALVNRARGKIVFMAGLSILLGLTTSGIIGERADLLAHYGHIGLLTLILWIYTYYLLLRSNAPGSE